MKNRSLNKTCQYLLVVLFVLLFQLHNLFQHFVYNNIYTYLTTCLTLPLKSQVVSFLISSAHCIGSFIIIIIIIYTIKVICKLNWQFWGKKASSTQEILKYSYSKVCLEKQGAILCFSERGSFGCVGNTFYSRVLIENKA